MYLLDTNVVSELRKVKAGKADRHVSAWANEAPLLSLFLSAVTVHELELGTLLLGRRDPTQAAVFRTWLDEHVLPGFHNRILPIDTAIAQRSATLHVPDPKPDRDAFIAATALVHGMSVVTRNVADFASTGVEVINPWE
jgi:predicted nucleic acid-binding protein